MLRKCPQASQAVDRPGSSSSSRSVLMRDHTAFPDEPADQSIEVKPETPTHPSEESQ